MKLFFIEPAYFIKWIDDHKNGYFNSSGYQLIQDGSKYILFLSHLKAPNGYHWSAEEKRSFLPVSQLYSKYPLNDDMNLEARLMDVTTEFINIYYFLESVTQEVIYMANVARNELILYPLKW